MNQEMKTIFITARVPILARYILRTGLLELLAKEEGIRVVLLVPKHREDAYMKEFGKVAAVIGLSPMPHSFASRFLLFCSHIGLHSSTNTLIRMRAHYQDGRSALIAKIKGILTRLIHNNNLLKKMVRAAELRISSTPELARVFETRHPSLVFATALMDDIFDIPVLREAKRRGIPTVAMARNWDNFTTFGITLLLPDWLIAQSQFLRETAVRFQSMPEKKIRVIGFPYFDWYGKKELLQSREEFCRELGINPQKKIILYGAMGDFMFPREGEIADIFEELMGQEKIHKPSVMVFRAHPFFTSPLEKMRIMKYVIPDKVRGDRSAIGDPALDFKDMRHFINSLYHSDIVVTAASTVGMEGVAFDKPTISVAFEKTKTPYWMSAACLQEYIYNWGEFMKCGGVRRTNTPAELAEAVNAYLENPRLDAEGRERARKRFVYPYDGKATKRLAEILIALLHNKTF